MVTTHNLGLARNDKVSALKQQQQFDFVSVGCSNVSDPMVTMLDLLGHRSEYKHCKAYQDATWFGSETRCVVPEFTKGTRFNLNADFLLREIEKAKQASTEELSSKVKPIIIGPISYLWFSEAKEGVNKLDFLEPLLAVYAELMKALSDAGIEWVQFDEPVITQELNEDWKHALLQAYFDLQRSPVKKLLACYFGKLGDNLGLLRELTVDGVHLDTISADDEALKVADWLPNYKIISVSVVDGSQECVTDFEDTLAWLKPIHEILGDRLWLAPSCSLMHLNQNADQKLADMKQIANALNEASQKANEQQLLNQRKAAA